ncbi:MAG: crossover junction endodeoxyribonuclease RuvC [Fimbriimonadaceae bacterium]|nr:crossover junction endodeoxyribonuclease RuvC [Fimbriimonadaceae bacterium]
MRVIGIDPGLERVGYAILDRVGSRLEVVAYGLISTPRIATPDRLVLLYEAIAALISQHEPASAATERLLFAANKTTAIDVAKAVGAIQVAIACRGISIAEYTPPEVKLAVVGNGRAEKAQVQFMVTKLLGLREAPKPDDVSDALAIAITHALRQAR